jgi:UDP-3-O-[3-hydroxymyristoyl] N-acetylglucosamine deacetylase
VTPGPQGTIASAVTLDGIGLHTGRAARMTLRPAPADAGITFQRTDRAGRAIPAALGSVTGTAGCVALGGADGVATVEHLLSAAVSLGADNLAVDVDGPELPGFDGSALPFVRALHQAGACVLDAPRHALMVREPVSVEDGDAWAVALPARQFSAAYVVTLGAGLGDQAATYDEGRLAYEETIAPARTWGYQRDAEALRARGMALGATLDNTLVIGDDGFLNPPRFPNEAARHKLLDLVGDLALLGRPICGRVVVVRGGHRLHVALARALARLAGLGEQGV